MGLQNLSDPMAFSSGAELWLVPDIAHSHWARKLDWYLNFQMFKASAHQAPTLAPDLLQLLDEVGLATPSTLSNQEAPLMISARHQLPARWAVELKFHGQLEEWLKRISTLWHQMNHPSTRIFLPTGIDLNQVQMAWPEPESQNISVVTDSDHQKTTRN